MPIEVVEPGSADDPFKGTSGTDSAGASTQGVPAGTVVEGQSQGQQAQAAQDASAEAAKAAASAAVDGGAAGSDDDELSEEEEAALEIFFQHKLETEVLPRIQSNVDRRIAALDAASKRDVAAAQAQTKQLQDELREVKLNGLSPEDQARLKAQWSTEDKKAELDAYEQQLESYHRDIVVANYVTEYPHLQLTPADFAEFTTPEQMEVFIALADREYWKELAARGGQPQPAASATAPVTKPAPAGATAPSDGSASHAAPETPKFNDGKGRQAMVDNIAGGWETVAVSR